MPQTRRTHPVVRSRPCGGDSHGRRTCGGTHVRVCTSCVGRVAPTDDRGQRTVWRSVAIGSATASVDAEFPAHCRGPYAIGRKTPRSRSRGTLTLGGFCHSRRRQGANRRRCHRQRCDYGTCARSRPRRRRRTSDGHGSYQCDYKETSCRTGLPSLCRPALGALSMVERFQRIIIVHQNKHLSYARKTYDNSS